MLTFVIAIAYLCFHTSTAQRAITAVVSGVVFSLVTWEITVHWKPSRFRASHNLFYTKDLIAHIKHWLMELSSVH